MGYSIDVNSSNFQTEVIENSYIKPILVDFYATWCGPCQLLKPILEKLVKEYDFTLAKIDIDQNRELANQFRVEGVPDVRVFSQGEMLPGFVGVLPEPQIRSLLSQFNLKSELDIKLEKARQAIAVKNLLQAKQIFDELFTKYPENAEVIIEASYFLVQSDRLEDAQKMLKTIGADNREYHAKAQAIQTLIEFKQITQNPGESELDQLFAKAANLTLVGDYEDALQLFLKLVQKDRKYRKDGGRKAMIAIFNLLGLSHPLTKQYQQELMMALY